MVKTLTLADLIQGMGDWRPDGLDMPVQPVVDSRKAEPGSVFFALKGENVDGHAYVQNAFAKGAIAAVVDHFVSVEAAMIDLENGPLSMTLGTPLIIRVPDVLVAIQKAASFWRQQFAVRVLGITGSVGKTTTKEVIARVLARRYGVLRSAGSYNNELGLPLTILKLTSECERLVLEMGMYVQGDIRFLAGIAKPHVGIVTNVEPVHAERAGSIDNIAQAKRELVEVLPPAPEGVAILNYDDIRVREMASHTQARVFFYGLSPNADLWADEIQSLGLEGIRLCLHYGKEKLYVRVPLLGRHSAHTVLRATATALMEGLSWQEIVEGLRSPSAQLRLVATPGPKNSLVLDDTYNASPPSTLAALNLLQDLDGRKVAVLGDMLELGAYEESGHRKVGCRAAGVVDVLLTVGERARWIAEDAIACGLSAESVYVLADSEAAIETLCQILENGDVILVKGSRALKLESIVAYLSKEA
ncbi:MAG: UDP-N-acetylmuramoyl-tripeptide--D-alanyl-D-alanine ligase [Anaerolineae bacterium]|nr:UDP-N-acetylmuramoyl-tripeptide--D-alanyl-D-alanine ligase [Anaerolineae bacterium]